MYEALSKIYYKDSNRYQVEYERRLSSYGTVKLPFNIKPFKSNQEFSCFYVNHPELDLLHDQISKQNKLVEDVIASLPPIGVKQYIQAKLIDELLSTNEIEGVRSTKSEMEDAIEIVVRKDIQKKNVRHLSLMRSYVSLLSETKDILETVKDIREIYNHLVQEEIKEEGNRLDGRFFRKESVDVKTSTGKVVHKGVYPEQAIETHLANLISYLNEHNSPMLYKIAIAHYYFGYIHPFYDGNGRTSRYISSMYLIHELDLLTALNLSYSTNRSKRLYYDAFDECNNPLNKGELTSFCEMFFQIIHKAQNDILADLSEKKEKMESLSGIITELSNKEGLSQEGRDILYILGQSYIFGIEGKGMTRQELISISEKTPHIISKVFRELSEKGLIEYLKRKPIEVRLNESLCVQLQ